MSRLRAGAAGLAARHLPSRRRPPTPDLTESLATLRRRWQLSAPDDSPVFLMGSGWRCGSTLLQRLVVSGGQAFIWGEPYARADHVRRLAEALCAIREDWPRDSDLWSHGGAVDDPAGTWIANLSPDPQTLLDAHRDFFRAWLRVPASLDQGAAWGLKEVRLEIQHAAYLRLLFPKARLVFQYRNPYEQWRSYAGWRTWYDRWPRGAVRTPAQFGRVWRRITEGFIDQADEIGVLVLRYDALVNDPAAVQALRDHLGVPVDVGVLADRQEGRSEGSRARVPASDMYRLRSAVEPLASRLGFTP